MKVAFLADIHANLSALQAVLGVARSRNVERLLLLGDYVGYYYESEEVLQELLAWPHAAVRGNHERMLFEGWESEEIACQQRERYGVGLDVARATLSPASLMWLKALPDRLSVDLDGIALELCHGSPFDPDKYVYPDTSPEVLERCVVPGRDLVAMGHTHYPMLAVQRGVILLNPGSVGQPRDVGGIASWAILDTKARTIVPMRTPYDPTILLAEVARREAGRQGAAGVLIRNNPHYAREAAQ